MKANPSPCQGAQFQSQLGATHASILAYPSHQREVYKCAHGHWHWRVIASPGD